MKYKDIPKDYLLNAAYNAHIQLEAMKHRNKLLELDLEYQKKMVWFAFYAGLLIALLLFMIVFTLIQLLPAFIAILFATIFMAYRANKAFNNLFMESHLIAEEWKKKI